MQHRQARMARQHSFAPLLWGCVLIVATAIVWTRLDASRSTYALDAVALVTALTIAPLLGIRVLVAWHRRHPGALLAFARRVVSVRRGHGIHNERDALGALLQLTPKQFELAVARMLPALGFLGVEHTGGGGDLGADIICSGRDDELVVVQCKRYAPDHLVGSPEVQQFIGMVAVHHRASRGIFVTTSNFTQPARDLAAQHPRLTLVDGQALARLALNVRRGEGKRQCALPAGGRQLPLGNRAGVIGASRDG